MGSLKAHHLLKDDEVTTQVDKKKFFYGAKIVNIGCVECHKKCHDAVDRSFYDTIKHGKLVLLHNADCLQTAQP